MNETQKVTIQDFYEHGYRHRQLMLLTIELLNSCNWDCKHCYLPEHKNMGLDYDAITKLLQQAKDLGVMEIVLTGGEIFLRDDILDIIKYARSLYFRVYLYSNASLLTPQIVQQLADCYITQYSLTLFSLDENIHDKITQRNGSLKTLLRNIDLLKKYNIPVEVKTPILSINRNSITEISEFCKINGFTFGTTPSINAKKDGNIEPLRLSLDNLELQSVLKTLEKLDTNTRLEHDSNNSFKPNKFNPKALCCSMITGQLFIDSEGNVFPCASYYYKVGNIKNDSLSNIWLHSNELHYVQSLRNSDLKECLHCELNEFCTRCPGQALLEDGNILGCSSSAKKFAKARKALYEQKL